MTAMFSLRQKLLLGFGGLLLIIVMISIQSIIKVTDLGEPFQDPRQKPIRIRVKKSNHKEGALYESCNLVQKRRMNVLFLNLYIDGVNKTGTENSKISKLKLPAPRGCCAHKTRLRIKLEEM